MAVRDVLRLGNPGLYRVCRPISSEELPFAKSVVQDLRDTLLHFRERHGVGRAIAAPQIGAFVRIVYCHVPSPTAMINPELYDMSDERMTIWDDCMSFPDLLVRVSRHRRCTIRFKDLDWVDREMPLADAMSELLQHEVDHLDGILAVSRAVDAQSFAYRNEMSSSP